jgi:hypothetical protein
MNKYLSVEPWKLTSETSHKALCLIKSHCTFRIRHSQEQEKRPVEMGTVISQQSVEISHKYSFTCAHGNKASSVSECISELEQTSESGQAYCCAAVVIDKFYLIWKEQLTWNLLCEQHFNCVVHECQLFVQPYTQISGAYSSCFTEILCSLISSCLFPLPSTTAKWTFHSLSLWIWPFLIVHVGRIVQYLSFCDCLNSLCIIPSSFLHVVIYCRIWMTYKLKGIYIL